MQDPAPQDAPGRFDPHAAREMASMFDDVSGRYDLLNRLMTLGRDRAWRAAMWRAIPESARTVLDLCTGNGVSLTGLRRPGRLVVGLDVSAVMLRYALEHSGRAGWAPRLVAADAFRIPLRASSVDAITIAFGVRNLRPRPEALVEMARVLRPGGTFAVLEAAAPRAGWFAPLHEFHLRHLVPLAGRLSPDPSAYRYLSQSIFEFGSGETFERDLEAAGFDRVERRAFMLGATCLWTGRRGADAGPIRTRDLAAARPDPTHSSRTLQNASTGTLQASEMPQRASAREREWRWWVGAQLATSLALLLALIYGLWAYAQVGSDLPLQPWQRRGLVILLLGGIVLFTTRSALLAGRLRAPPER